MALHLEIFTDKIADGARRVIRRSYDEVKARDHSQLLPEHILYAEINLERPLFNAVTQSLNLDPQAVLQALETRLGRHFYGFNNRPIKMSESLRILLANALKQAHAERRRLLEASDLFIAIFKDRESFPVALLQKLGASRELVIEEIQNQVRGRDEPDSRTQPDQRGHRS